MSMHRRLGSLDSYLLPVWITLFGAGLRLYGLSRQSLWSDEGFSLAFASVPAEMAWEALLTDAVHPPLYYGLLRVTLWLGRSEVALRLPSVFAGILAIPLAYALALRLTRRRNVALFVSLLLSVCPFHVWYSQEARMYSLFVSFGLVVMYTFVRALDTGGALWWGVLALSSGVAYVTHYFALYLALIQFVFLVVTLRQHHGALRTWVLVQALAVVPLALWLVAVYSGEGTGFGIGWIPHPGPIDLALTLWSFSLAYTGMLNPWVIVGLAAMWGIALYGVIRKEACASEVAVLALLWLFVPLLFSLLLSLIVPLYVDRFFIFALPAYLLLVSCGVMSLKSRIVRAAWGALVVILALVSVMGTYSAPAFAKEDWRGLAGYLGERVRESDVVALRYFQYKFPFEYYYTGAAQQEVLTTNRETRSIPDVVEGRSRLWLIYRERHGSSHHLALTDPFDVTVDEDDPEVLSWLESHQDSMIERGDRFAGLYLFAFELGEQE
jgi:mannosyltransferase